MLILNHQYYQMKIIHFEDLMIMVNKQYNLMINYKTLIFANNHFYHNYLIFLIHLNIHSNHVNYKHKIYLMLYYSLYYYLYYLNLYLDLVELFHYHYYHYYICILLNNNDYVKHQTYIEYQIHQIPNKIMKKITI